MGKFWRQSLLYVLLLLLGLGLGYGVFQASWGRPQVGVIRVNNVALYSETVADIAKMLDYAQRAPSIKAVAITLSSPGGGASESEALFRRMLLLQENKPVVVSIDQMAASGGYMVAVGANYIYATATSFVGNVGAIMFLPKTFPPPEEEIVATGPFKWTGASRRTYVGMLEMVKDAFVRLVVTQRGDRLRISPQELAEGRIYLGMEAVRYGLVDELGTETDAIGKAASLAGIKHYGVVDINKQTGTQWLGFAFSSPSFSTPPQGQYHRIDYLYMEPK